jgi:cytohesin
MKNIILTTIAAVLLVGCATMLPPAYSLSYAIKKGDIETVKQRLDASADVNAPIPSRKSSSEVVTAGVLTGVFLASTGGMGGGGFGGGRKTILPLRLAAEFGRKEIAELLIAKGADVNVKDFTDLTLLHFAARKDHHEVAELLIANSADVNAKERRGRTPLHTAAYWGGKEVAALLIAKGADVNAKDKSAATPLGGAIRRKHTELANLLRKHGGKTGAELEAAGR